MRREELRFSTPCRPRGGCGLWDRRELEEGRGAKDVYCLKPVPYLAPLLLDCSALGSDFRATRKSLTLLKRCTLCISEIQTQVTKRREA